MNGIKDTNSMYLREDESDDSLFYVTPRFEKHIDDETIDAITRAYGEYLKPGSVVLDLMSSWISHLPENMHFEKVSGLGMNEEELKANKRLNDFVVHDLNRTPDLPYSSNQFDAVLIAVSIQYLIRPVEVFKSIGRVLKPDGVCMVSTSHRIFPSKVIRAFTLLPAAERCRLVASYFEFSGGFQPVDILDRSPLSADPLWIIMARKKN
jgi:ubiquinone/menaquinone biosynthesis C-methylase UbiE